MYKKNSISQKNNPFFKKKFLRLFLVFSLSIATIYAIIFYETYSIEITQENFISPDLPKNFINKKLVLISDIHHGPNFPLPKLIDLVNKINSLNPDIIIIAGDLTSPDKKYISPALSTLNKLQAPLGIYLALGNHDYWKEGPLVENFVKKTKIKLLKNENYWIKIGNQKISIAGVEDPWYGKPDINKSQKNVNSKDFSILISHNPDELESHPNSLVDISLSGHTHGGQINFFGLYAPISMSKYGQKFISGWSKSGTSSVYTSRGIGTTKYPLRLFSRPEITVITLDSS